jgi:hypothetical protein
MHAALTYKGVNKGVVYQQKIIFTLFYWTVSLTFRLLKNKAKFNLETEYFWFEGFFSTG